MFSRLPLTVAFLPLLLALSLTASPAYAAGTPGSTASKPPPEGESAAAEAMASYRSGLDAKERAWQEETAATETQDPQSRDQHLALAQQLYREAVDAQGAALKIDPRYAEAANELGYALRQTGDYRKAIGAYNYALLVRPDFYEAIEYRGEAFLGVQDLEGAKSAYLKLFREAPALGTTLLAAMQSWIDAQSSTAGSTEASVLAPFAAWVSERRELETLTQDVGQIEPRRW